MIPRVGSGRRLTGFRPVSRRPDPTLKYRRYESLVTSGYPAIVRLRRRGGRRGRGSISRPCPAYPGGGGGRGGAPHRGAGVPAVAAGGRGGGPEPAGAGLGGVDAAEGERPRLA